MPCRACPSFYTCKLYLSIFPPPDAGVLQTPPQSGQIQVRWSEGRKGALPVVVLFGGGGQGRPEARACNGTWEAGVRIGQDVCRGRQGAGLAGAMLSVTAFHMAAFFWTGRRLGSDS